MEIEKKVFSCVFPPPRDQENPFRHSCSFTLQTSYKNGMLGPGVGAGEGCQNAQKQSIIKSSDFNNFV